MPNRCYMCKEEKKNECSYSSSLPESLYIVASYFCFIQCSMGDALFGERFTLELGRLSCWWKKEKGLEGCSIMPFLSIQRERNRRAFENCECSDHSLKSSFLYLFWDWVRLYIRDWVRLYIGEGSLSMLDFVDWLRTL